MRQSDTASAALWLGAALLGAALAAPPARPGPCGAPRELVSREGWSHRVACRRQGASGRVLRGPARLLFGLGLDPNRAEARLLEVLPGIGPIRAAAIVAAGREQPFCRAADLLRVPGIGPRTLGRIRPLLRFPGVHFDPVKGCVGEDFRSRLRPPPR